MRIVIAEDSTLLREGLSRLLADEGHEVVAGVGNAVELHHVVEREVPDLVLLDVRMPPTYSTEGIDAARCIKEEHPQVAVLVLSQYVEHRNATGLLTNGWGGVGYLLKDRVSDVGRSSPTWNVWPRAGRPSIPRWCGNCSRAPAAPTLSPPSPNANARCSRPSPRG